MLESQIMTWIDLMCPILSLTKTLKNVLISQIILKIFVWLRKNLRFLEIFSEILVENIGSSPEKLNPQCPSSFNCSVRAGNIKSADTVVDRPHQASRVSQSEVAGKELPPKVKKRRGRKEGKELDLMSTKPITHFFRKEAPDLHSRLKGESNTGKENLDNLNLLNL